MIRSTQILALAVLAALAGCDRLAETMAPQSPPGAAEPATAVRAAVVSASLDDAIERVLPHLEGPEAPALGAALRQLREALADTGLDVVSASAAAHQALAAWQAVDDGRDAAHLDVIRLALDAAANND